MQGWSAEGCGAGREGHGKGLGGPWAASQGVSASRSGPSEIWQCYRWLHSSVITGGGFVLGFPCACCSSLPDALGRAGYSGQWDNPAAG